MANESHSSRRTFVRVCVFFPPLIVHYVLTHDWTGDCMQVQEAPYLVKKWGLCTKAAVWAASEGVYQPAASVCCCSVFTAA